VSHVITHEHPATPAAVEEPVVGLYGLLAEFDDPSRLTDAIKRARAEGYSRMDAYTPYPVADVADALGVRKTEMSAVMFTGGLIGALGGFLMQYWTMSIDYPINIAGRPFIFPDTSWPSFIPVTFEMTILTTAITGVVGLLAACGLPRLHHPLFGVPRFALASRDKFFLCIESTDKKFDRAATREFLASLQPQTISEVPE
jgi:hypothetical protein